MQQENDRLENIAKDSWYNRGANAKTILYSAKIFSRYWEMINCLELGPAEGMMTGILYDAFENLTVVEGAKTFCDDLKLRFPNANIIHSLFEEFTSHTCFDTIILGHVLEHVENPVEILKKAKEWLSPNGVICAAVPNARSLHRQAAVIMGLLPTEFSLNETDIHHGHRRVYTPETFRADFALAGLKVKHFGGYWLKPLSNAQIEQYWTMEMLDSFMQLGERYPDIAGEIYVIASN
jgi:SAM-dependent methyltransferase